MITPMPESNGWPTELPHRPWVPTLCVVDLQPGDWIRHGRIIPAHRFWQVRALDFNRTQCAIVYVIDPEIGLRFQPIRSVFPAYTLVEVRLLFPAQIQQHPLLELER